MYTKKHILKIIGISLIGGVIMYGAYSFATDGGPFSSSLHSAATEESSSDSLDFFKSSKERLGDLITDFQARNDLTSALPFKKLHASADKITTPSYNDYFNLKNASVDSSKDMLTFSFSADAKKFLQEQEAVWCPPAGAPSLLSSSGSKILNNSGSKLLGFQYFINLDNSTPTQGGFREIGFNTKEDLNDIYIFEEKFSVESLSEGKHTLMIVPSCEHRFPSKTSLLEPFIIAAPFEKKPIELSSIPKADATTGMLRVLSPELDSVHSGEALISIPYIGNDGKKAFVKVPYIQTNPDLTVRVAIDINAYLRSKYANTDFLKLGEKKRIDNDPLSISMLLVDQHKKITRHVESPFFFDTMFNEDSTKSYWKEVELVLAGIPKGTYTLVIRLNVSGSKNGFVHHSLVSQSQITSLAIGDIILAFGDDRTEGKGSAEVTSSFTTSREAIGLGDASSDSSGRHIVWSPKYCETGQKELCGKAFVAYASFTKRLGEQLSDALDYPVMVINEGLGGKTWTIGDIAEYLSTPSASLKERIAVLQPNIAIITIDGKNQLEQVHQDEEHAEEKVNSALTEITKRIDALLPSDNNIFFAIPEYTGDPLEHILIKTIRTFVMDETRDIYPGADLYTASIEKKDTGLSHIEVADIWAKSLTPYLIQRSDITPTTSP